MISLKIILQWLIGCSATVTERCWNSNARFLRWTEYVPLNLLPFLCTLFKRIPHNNSKNYCLGTRMDDIFQATPSLSCFARRWAASRMECTSLAMRWCLMSRWGWTAKDFLNGKRSCYYFKIFISKVKYSWNSFDIKAWWNRNERKNFRTSWLPSRLRCCTPSTRTRPLLIRYFSRKNGIHISSHLLDNQKTKQRRQKSSKSNSNHCLESML